MKIDTKVLLTDSQAQKFEDLRAAYNQENNLNVRRSAFATKLVLDSIAGQDTQVSMFGGS